MEYEVKKMAKWNEDYWTKPFGVMNPEQTRMKHSGRIMKAKDIPYDEIVHPFFEDNVTQYVISGFPGRLAGSGWFSGFSERTKTDEKGALMKSSVKELKSVVNWRTREEITNQLVSHGYPKSWDTAFYMAHYNKINEMMKRIVKDIVTNYV